ncbi:hypothetical protein HZA75_04090 [Candidatus Roizmanbacteria bacterium]|nr:hypothetical protein [Candidatus Roizmanbacteria bacterium]
MSLPEKGQTASIQTFPNGVTFELFIKGPFNGVKVAPDLILARTPLRPVGSSLPTNGADLGKLTTFFRGIPTGEFDPLPPGYTNAEDTRFTSNDKPREGVIGFTAVRDTNSGEITWHPALVPVRIERHTVVATGETEVFDEIRGKNGAPDNFNVETGGVKLTLRHDDRGLRDLTRYFYNLKTGRLEELDTISVPERPWNKDRIGTVGKPVEIGGREVTLLHGQQFVQNPDGTTTIVYSIGAAVIENGRVTAITDEPFLYPIQPNTGKAKNVVYSVDNARSFKGSDGKQYLKLLVSIDDNNLVEVTIPGEVITNGLRSIRRH